MKIKVWFVLFTVYILKVHSQPIGYQYGKVITINSAVVTGTNNLIDFPFLIKITDSDLRSTSNGGNVSNTSGHDIIFTDESCVNTLKHDLESYNPVTGELVCWIRIPTLSYNVNTVLHMYYNNSSVAAATSTDQTWSSDYACVLHLANSPTVSPPQMLDATSSANSGTCQGSMTSTNSVNGKIGQALLFDEIDDVVVLSDFDYTQSFTISFWFLLSEVNGTAYQYFFSHGNFGANNSCNIYIGEDNVSFVSEQKMLKNIFQDSNDGTNTAGLDATNVYANSFWHYYSFVVGNSGGATVYVDGVQKAYISILGGNVYNPPTNIHIGGRSDLNASRFLGGIVDELRILNAPRSAEWIATEYTNQNSPATYYSVGAQTSATVLCVVLPIELIYFKAQVEDEAVKLLWATASEKNNQYFTIERSSNGVDFETIGTVSGSGNSSRKLEYAYTDFKPLKGISYYRLKQTDIDGKYDYSQITSVSFTDHQKTLKLWPNPTDGRIVLNCAGNKFAINDEIVIYDGTGSLIFSHFVTAEEVGEKLDIDLKHLNKGFYYLEVKGLNRDRVKLILK